MEPLKLIVRRGALRRFHKLKRDTANLPVSVEWDRRQQTDSDSRPAGADRRKRPPFTWETADFVVVEDDVTEPSQE